MNIIKAMMFKHTFDLSVKSSHNGSTLNRMGYNSLPGRYRKPGRCKPHSNRKRCHTMRPGKMTKLQTNKLQTIDKQIGEAEDGSAQNSHGAGSGGCFSWRGSRARSGSQSPPHHPSQDTRAAPGTGSLPGHGLRLSQAMGPLGEPSSARLWGPALLCNHWRVIPTELARGPRLWDTGRDQWGGLGHSTPLPKPTLTATVIPI